MRKRSVLEEQLHRMSAVILNPADCSEARLSLSGLRDDELDGFLQLLTNHHVMIRTLEPLLACDSTSLRWSERARQAIADERERIRVSIEFLNAICGELEAAGGRVVIFKTLDHWPDFGNDLDLFVTGDEVGIQNVLTR